MAFRWTAILALVAASCSNAQSVSLVNRPPPNLKPLHFTTVGRVERQKDASVLRQWPGTYFETAASGDAAFFQLGPGDVILRLSADDGEPVSLLKPVPGIYRVGGLGSGTHRLRIDVASESQGGPTTFGGFLERSGSRSAPLHHRSREIEFIGDSHTVGYGNTSPKRECSEDQVWATTDTSQGIAKRTAKRYDADYQVNAISGRGIVRNYNGSSGDTLPQMYGYTLFDKKQPVHDPNWHPEVIVVGLGTNDFSTPLNAGERWKSRNELRADFEATYVRFLEQLRSRNTHAYIILWATDLANGEIASESSKVVDRFHQAGDTRVGFVLVRGLEFTACNYHPSLADDQAIANAITGYIDARPEVWRIRH